MKETFAAQHQTAQSWKSSTAEERIARLKSLKGWIELNQQEIRTAVRSDFYKADQEIDLTEIYPAISEINHAINNLKSWMKPKKMSTPIAMIGTKSFVIPEPRGRALIISPWNFPFNLTLGPLVSALSAGCTVIIKTSELTPSTSDLIYRMADEVFKSNEVAVFPGEVEVAQELLTYPFEHIFFTGSTAVGKVIMKAASENLSSVTLELGGKSPTIIHQDADLKDAAEKIIFSKMMNSGQTCVAPDYILVHADCYELLVMELKVTIQKFYDPKYLGLEASPDLTRIVNKKHFHRLRAALEEARSKGAELLFGGKSNEETNFIEPTLLGFVTDEMTLMQEEIFGPILPITIYKDLDEAISFINNKPKPLALYYFGKEKEAIDHLLKQTSSGNVVINDCVIHFLNLEMPFGGVNNSGIGKSHGYYGFLAFSHEKAVLKQRVGYTNVSPLRPPFGKKTQYLISSLIKWF